MVANETEESKKLSLICQLVELAKSLRQERLFVVSEQSQLQQLNAEASHIYVSSSFSLHLHTVSFIEWNVFLVFQVDKLWFDLSKLSWIARQQRMCVNKLSISHCDYSPASCCSSMISLDKAEFEDAHKVLNYQVTFDD